MIGEYTFGSTGYSVIRINNLYFIVPPSLITRPTDQTIMENKEFTFNCTASGNPTPKITWIKDGKTVVEGDKLKRKAHRSHTGRYWCLAENGLDVSANASAYLDVQCKYGSSVVTE